MYFQYGAGMNKASADTRSSGNHVTNSSVPTSGSPLLRNITDVTDVTDAYVDISAEDAIPDWNAHAAVLFGWTAKEVCGQPPAAALLIPVHAQGMTALPAAGRQVPSG
jgi:hypothetical protein